MNAKFAGMVVVLALLAAMPVRAAVSDAEFEAMKKEMSEMRAALGAANKAPEAAVTSTLDKSLNASVDQPVTTGHGKLTMGGLVQVWYSTIQNDKRGLFHGINGVVDDNQYKSNDGFQVHTVELYFDMAIHDNVSAYVYINPAAEIGTNTRPITPKTTAANLLNQGPGFNNWQNPNGIRAVQTGAGGTNALLQDAIINYHGVIPHHDITVGQMLNTFNEENFAANDSLDFVDRSYIGNQVSRDIGAVLHGSWWGNGGGGSYCGAGDTGRVQYWLGVWNGASNLFGTYGGGLNRTDDNDSKDFVGTFLLRPIWNDCIGKLELGYSYRGGYHGQNVNPLFGGNDGNPSTWSYGHDGWMKYWAPGCLKGFWLKGELEYLHDRNANGSLINFGGPVNQGVIAGRSPEAFSTLGYWAAIGYKFADSPLLCNCDHSALRNLELDFRYESAPNVLTARTANDARTNVFRSKVYTAGVNYYIRGQNAKLQFNYNKIINPDGIAETRFHNTKQDSFVVNFQVSW